MIAVLFAQSWASWLSEFYELNIDRWLLVGWSVLAVLTVIAAVGMLIKIVKSNKGMRP